MVKAPRRDCRSKKKWAAYYHTMGLMYEIGSHACQPGSRARESALRDAARFYDGAKEIKEGTHPHVMDGTWK
jgi:hypothetical protein